MAVLGLTGCGREQGSQTENIFGPDNRETADSSSRPYSAVGRLDNGCTGTLIGRRLVLTAAHCVVDNATGTVRTDLKYFRPAFSQGSSREALFIDFMWFGSEKPEDNRTQDWAVVRLERAVDDSYGKWAIHEVDFAAALPNTVSLIGYSSDRDQANSASLHRGCYVHEVSEGRLFHDCDATAGVSGGPLFKEIQGTPHIVGITVSEFRRGAPASVTREDGYERDYANVGVPAGSFAAAARTLLQTADAGIAAPHQDGVFERNNPNSRDQDPVDPNNPDPNGQRPWEQGYDQAHLASRTAIANAYQQIGARLDALRYEANEFDGLADQYRDQTLVEVVRSLRTATADIKYLVEQIVLGRVVANLGQNLFYNYRVLNEQEATLYQFTGWQSNAALQHAVDARRDLVSQKMRALEGLLFVR
jgi:protease YdgD